MYSNYNCTRSQTCSGLTIIEQNQIRNFFHQIAGIDRGIDRNEFFQMIVLINPQLRNNYQLPAISDSLFYEIDSDRNGVITENEFIYGYGRLRHRLDSINFSQLRYSPTPQASYGQFSNTALAFGHNQLVQPQYGFQPNQLQTLFLQIAGYDRGINREEFTRLLILINPTLNNYPQLGYLSENLFRQIDFNQTGIINQTEFIAAYPSLYQHLQM